jgi:hypothetical protein
MTFRTEYHLFIKIIIVIIKLEIIMRFISPKTVLWKSVNGWKILYLKKMYYDLLASFKYIALEFAICDILKGFQKVSTKPHISKSF